MMNGLNKEVIQRLQIAYFSPLPPTRSGIADYSGELLPYLAHHADITLFVANPHRVDDAITQQFLVQSIARYPEKRWQYDIPLYQMGNNAHHEAMYQMYLRYPGLVILHDYSLYHFMTHRTAGSDRPANRMREVGYELDTQGIERIRRARMGKLTQSLNTTPFNKRLLDLSLGTIVHSHYTKNLIMSQGRETAVTVIPSLMEIPVGQTRRHQLPWPKNAIIFASVGQITPAKQLESALRAFKKVRQANPNVYYLIVGEEMQDINLSRIIHTLDLSNSVRHIGYVADKQEFIDWIYTADVIVNLRYPTIGETSGTALRALAVGRPLILSDHGWYNELPDSACIKIPPRDEGALFTAMLLLAQSAQKRQQLGNAGRQYIQNEHRPEHVANAYAAFISQQVSRLKPNDGN